MAISPLLIIVIDFIICLFHSFGLSPSMIFVQAS